MSLKKCDDCGQNYSENAEKCIHCGAPNNDGELGNFLGSLIVFAVIGWFIYANSASLGTFIKELLNAFNVGAIAESNFQDCDNDRIKTSMKQAFDESPSAQSYHLKAVIIETKQKKTSNGYVLSCNAKITLNNNEVVAYTFNFSKQNNQYLIEGVPRY